MSRRNILLSVLSGVLLCFSFPNFVEKTTAIHTWFFIWFAYIPVIYAVLSSKSEKEAFLYGFISGAVFYLLSLYWLCNVKPMGAGAYAGWAVLSLYLSLFYGLTFYAAKRLERAAGIACILTIPVFFAVFDYIREWFLSGFPLLNPAQSQLQFVFIIQSLKYAGVYGLDFLILAVNTAAAYLMMKRRVPAPEARAAGLISLLIVVFAVMGNLPDKGKTREIKAAILQSNISQEIEEWTEEYRSSSMKTYRELTKEAAAEEPLIIVWPETAYPGILNVRPYQAVEVARWSGAYNIIGSDSVDMSQPERLYYNSVFYISPEGELLGSYSKMHLVPFGEYVPLQHTFSFVRKVVRRYGYLGFTPGKEIEPVEVDGIKMGAVVCYDSLFPEISREYARRGTQLLAHLSYESWYGNSAASAQIFTNTALRAVENDVYIVRAVASGISGIVDNRGRIIRQTGLFTKEALTGTAVIKEDYRGTFYSFAGDWFPYFVFCVMLMLVVIRLKEGLIENPDN